MHSLHRYSECFRRTRERQCKNQHQRKTDSSVLQLSKKIEHKYTRLITRIWMEIQNNINFARNKSVQKTKPGNI